MKPHKLLSILCCVGLGIAAAAAPSAAPAKDKTAAPAKAKTKAKAAAPVPAASPAAVATGFWRAVVKGDQATAVKFSVGSSAGDQVRAAVDGFRALQASLPQNDPETEKTLNVLRSAKFVDGEIKGDVAVAYMVVVVEVNGRRIEHVEKSNPLKLRKVNGRWKVDLDSK